MSLADTGKAIGAVSQMLKEHLVNHPAVSVDDITIGKVEPASSSSNSRSRLNLFLYEILFDPHLRQVSLDEGQPPPLWLVLKYLLTAFDTFGDSDSIEAHGLLGEGLRALQELSLLPLIGSVGPLNTIRSLRDNPEPLKITFDQTPSDLLSKLMQGSDEKYRCSIGFEIRPVMIATNEPPSYSLLVGINYQDDTIVGETGIQIPVIPSLGPTITEVIPTKIEPGITSTLTLRGNDLNLSGLAVQLGAIELPITSQTPDSLQCQVNGTILDGRAISAGSHPVSAVQILPTGRRRSSNLLVVDILPILDSASVSSISRVDPANLNSDVFGTIDLTGSLLGREQDDIFLALYRDGKTFKVFDNLIIVPSSPPPSPPPLQKQLQLVMQPTQAVPPGLYRAILRVNGQQAKRSPTIDLRVP
ncbi:MAG: DUF4255 domain-containing protein [Oscillatoriaceae cyanobacterium Prado104]|jgi:hypothetical protein|nr:DUF4255 domain-containing protein [Oscillatoriaceae cyanobacterium Prado104]